MMRILHLVHQYPPQCTTGTEVLAHETAKAQVAMGHEVEVLAAELVDDPARAAGGETTGSWDGITVHRYAYCQRAPSTTTDPFRAEYANPDLQACLARRIAAFRPTVVNAFHLFRITAAAVDTVHAAGVPLVFVVTDFWSICQTINLRLPDGSVCAGPQRNSFNCLRHLGGTSVPGWARHIPAPLMELGARWLRWWRRNAAVSAPIDYAASLVLRQSYVRRRIRRIAAVVVPSQVMHERMAPLRIAPRRMHRIPFGLNLDYMRDAPSKHPSARLRIGFIGTISPPKGLHVLVQAFKELAQDAPVELRIHGRLTDDSEYAEGLQAALSGDARARFLGHFPNAQIGEVFAHIDVLVVPSVWLENTPLIISTAQAARTPVIATDLGGMAEAIAHERDGLLFPVADHHRLAAHLSRLVADPELLARLGAAARVPKSITSYAQDLLAVYRSITKGGS